MSNVPIPSITDKFIISYLKENNLINAWNIKLKNDKGEVIGIETARPTYRELCSNDEEWKHDKVFEWHEQHFDERGNNVGTAEQKLFSIHTYGRFFYKMTPEKHNSIFEQLKQTGLTIFLKDGEEKLYYDQHIQTPNELFTKIMELTMLKHTDEYSNDVDTIKKLQRMLAQMLKKYPSLAIHIDFLKALKVSMSYKQEVDKMMRIVFLSWDNWYLKQIINYVPYLIQRPYYNKEKKIKPQNQIYTYHLFTYQSLFFKGKRKYLSTTEINDLCGKDLKIIYELTPAAFRVHYRDLNEAKQRLVRKCFDDVEGGIEKTHEEYIQGLINQWLEKDKYTKKSIQSKGTGEIKATFRKKYGKGWKGSYIVERITKVVNEIEWWGSAEQEDEYNDETDDEITVPTEEYEDGLLLIDEYTDRLSDNEKRARRVITDYFYRLGIFEDLDTGVLRVRTMTTGTRETILKMIERFNLSDSNRFLNKIKEEFLSGTWDGKSKAAFIADYRKRHPPKIKSEVNKNRKANI